MANQASAVVSLHIEGLDLMKDAFEKLAAPLGFESIGKFEATLATMFAHTDAKVHVLTGALKASGLTYSTYDGDKWTGNIEYARDPGIFELARGNEPTLNHPEGQHFFFDGAYDLLDEVEEDLVAWFDACMREA